MLKYHIIKEFLYLLSDIYACICIIYCQMGPADGSKPYTRNRMEETLVGYPQQTMLNKFKQSWPKMAFVCVLGIVVSYVIGRGRELTAFVWIINAVFSAGLALLLVGIAHQLTNMHMFTSLSYGVKLLKMIFRNEHKSADNLKDDYIEYRNSRKHHDDVSLYMLCAAILIAISALLSLLFML